MLSYIQGEIIEKTPTYVVIETTGIGYMLFISINTYEQLKNHTQIRLHTRLVVKNENQNVTGFNLYGFYDKVEKELFEKLLSVSGVGANTAIMMLSTYNPEEIQKAILQNDVELIKSIKGIGPKSAQRIILELKDKISTTTQFDATPGVSQHTLKEEALMALVSLGFSKNASVKAINTAMLNDASLSSVEELIKHSLKLL